MTKNFCRHPQATILLIDDAAEQIQLLDYFLKKAGYTNIISSTNPHDAADLFHRIMPDVMLIDYRMPGLTGIDVLHQILKADSDFLPLIMLTADNDPEIKYDALAHGVQDFITKPFNEIEVLARINTTIHTSFMHKQLKHENRRLDIQYNHSVDQLKSEILARTDAEDQLQHNLLHDALTRLPNKFLFSDRIQQSIEYCKRSAKWLSILLINIDNIKTINTALGHSYGDSILKLISQRVRQVTRTLDPAMHVDNDTQHIARLSGNSFIIGLTNLDTNEMVVTIYERIIREITQPYNVENIQLEPVCHTGIAHYPDHGVTADELIQHADTAACHAKQSHQPLCVYSSELDHDTRHNLLLMQDLKTAIKTDALTLYLQPKIDLKTSAIAGYECLLRWIHPEHGFIPPNLFIKIAEETGQISQLTRWVIEHACQVVKTLEQHEVCHAVSINLTASDLTNPEQIAFLLDTVHKHSIKPQLLTLEITEGSMITDPKQAHEIIHLLSSTGFQLSIDDFGTGYSSLAYLQKLSVHELKIDKSFVLDLDTNTDNQKIVQSIIDIAHHLHLTVVAEGIENQVCYQQLVDFGCDYAQGFYMSKPLPMAPLLEFIRSYAAEQADRSRVIPGLF